MVREETKQYLTEAFSEIDTYQKFVKLYSALKVPRLYLKDTGIPSRNISHWKNYDLLHTKKEESDGWNTFNYFDYIWLKIIEEMRKFGLPLKTIKKIKKVLIEKLDIKWNADTLNEFIEYGIKTIEKLSMNNEDKNSMIQLISNPDFKETVRAKDIIPSTLNSLVICTLIKNEEVGIIVLDDGEAIAWMDEFHSQVIGVERLLRKSHLYISITGFVAEFLSDTTKEKFIPYYLLISKDELEILRRMREKDLQEIVIKFPKGSGKENIDIITKKNVGLSKEQQDEICRILSLKNYQSITIKNQGDGKLYLEKSHRKKLS